MTPDADENDFKLVYLGWQPYLYSPLAPVRMNVKEMRLYPKCHFDQGGEN